MTSQEMDDLEKSAGVNIDVIDDTGTTRIYAYTEDEERIAFEFHSMNADDADVVGVATAVSELKRILNKRPRVGCLTVTGSASSITLDPLGESPQRIHPEGWHAREVLEMWSGQMSLYREFQLALELLRHIDPAKIITCRCCFGSQPEPQYCGCGGN